MENYHEINFYGIRPRVRLPEASQISLKNPSSENVSEKWKNLSSKELNNTLYDCLKVRKDFNLSDWAYLQFLDSLATYWCRDKNGATLLKAFLFCQSGYQMRLGEDNGKLVLLIGSDRYIYEMPYYIIDGAAFYPIGETPKQLKICNANFESERPISLNINNEQLLGTELSDERSIKSKRFPEVTATSKVPVELIKFFDGYPSSAAHDNPLTRWAMYANTPLAEKTKEQLYPSLKKSIEGDSNLEAANKLLNWVQTGFVYEYDDKVWGHDRAFFAEETLYYPYADCEDRSILYSRLIRDLLGLDVALIYYPGHIATAVKFDSEVPGNTMIIDGKRFVVCDPTYIGAPVGAQMPNLEYDKAQIILLEK